MTFILGNDPSWRLQVDVIPTINRGFTILRPAHVVEIHVPNPEVPLVIVRQRYS